MLRKVLWAISISVVLGMLAGGICFGQIKSGTITGRVTDSSSAVVPGASVTVVNEGTKVPLHTVTGGTGDYTVPFLEPGTYDVTITKEGFTTFTQTGVAIGVSATVQVDAQLPVGRTATVVEVKGQNAVALQTETATVGDTVNTNAISELPDINHNPFYFATLQPGVTGRWQLMDTTSAESFGIGIYTHDEYSAFSINGSAAFSANITVDGVNVQGSMWNEAEIEPAPESIQEVKTYTSDYDASLGRGQGAVAIVTKSGTNNYHGVVFGRLRNDALDANLFANDVQDVAKPSFKVGYYGAAVGGPIKKDKAFFFASWQGMAHNAADYGLLNVPMNNQAKGDFSSPEGCPTVSALPSGETPTANDLGTCVSVGGVATPIQLFNPFSATLVNGIYQHALITGPNGVSDETLVADPAAVDIFSYYPPANRFPTDQYNDNNNLFSALQTYRSQTISSRADVSHGKHNLYFAGGIDWGTINTPTPWTRKPPEFYYVPGSNGASVALNYTHNPYGAIGDTIAISPTLIVDVRFGAQRTHGIYMMPIVSGVPYTAMGMPSTVQAILPQPGAAPDFGVNPVGQWTTLQDTATGHKNEHTTNYHLAASATKVRGNWTFKFGGEYLGDLSNTPNLYYSGGNIAADGCGGCEYTNPSYGTVSQNTTANIQGLPALGDIMMGAGYWNIPVGQTVLPALEEQYMGLYTQNTWKVTPRLTLNLGLRWDLQPGPSERHNMMAPFDPTATTNPICTNTAIDPSGFGCQGAFYFVGINGHSRHYWDTHYTDFGPRVGFAYRMKENTVVRGGYGISYLPTNTGLLFGPYSYAEWPWGYGTTQYDLGATPAGVPIGPMEDAAVSPVVSPPVGAQPSSPEVYGYWSQAGEGPQPYPRNYEDGYMQQYNLFVEKKMGNWLLSVGYTGSHGNRLPVLYFDNGENTALFNAPSVGGSNVITCFHAGLNCAPSDSSVAAAGGYLGTGSDPYSQQVPNPFNPTGTLPFQTVLKSATFSRGYYDGPFPLFPNQIQAVSIGYSSYNALQVEAKHQISHGLMLDVSYTWSKELDFSYLQSEHNQATDTDVAFGQFTQEWDQINPHANRRYGLDDIPNRFLANLVYELPFGTGHSMNPGNKVASYLASGWSIGATEMDESGYPIDIYDNDPGSLDSRPNRAPGEPLLLPKSLQHWYNGKTTVALPDGRSVTPANYTFLKFNPDAFVAPVIPSPTSAGKYINDTYWMGDSAINYSTIRDPSINNLNFTLRRSFKLTERFTVEVQANATNLLNHPNIETYSTDLGSGTELTPNNSSNIPLGYPTNSANTFGTHGLTDFDNRQIEFQLRVKF